ncbi:hypothetical protein FLL45_02960 [Aliikangiella marina]|uniref:Molybdopterin synthase catalytic subunit n=1 Tax=Aliikangiella marina TaxID=1712262 RepID=A0A545TI97_9GAMM|nr:molybdenum cofactor biosynthesis protein MoaE [Aliikangiella marina]TQV76928.1 hypothetical protein FLL45_02960 [Aliikangiella marina]
MANTAEVIISPQPFDLARMNQAIQESQGESGASVIFTGAVRVSDAEAGLTGMTLEHYPGMTEKQLAQIIGEAKKRWRLNKIYVAHRVGYLKPGEPIVFVGVSGLHRAESFSAAQFIMDYLKQKATFWKKEHYGDKEVWVEAKASDEKAAERWI